MSAEAMLVEDGYAVGRLIAYALKSAKPSRDGEYKQLIDQYIYEEPFAQAVDQVLEGMGLQVLNESTQLLRSGLVLGCLGSNSPFAPNLETHAKSLNREQRIALGIIHLAIMTFYYPQVDEDEDDFRTRSGTPSEIAADIRQLCETLKQHKLADQDTVGLPTEQIEQSFSFFLGLPPAPARGGAYLPKSTQVGLVNYALAELSRHGFLSVEGGEGVNLRYMSLPKYKVYVRRLASHKLAQIVRGARQQMSDVQEGEASDV